jgi:endonuclease YncB( thermonuclease family)
MISWIRLAPLLAFLTICLNSSPTLADNLIGQASVTDGDTLEIHGTSIRLWGIDAPESRQLCRNDESELYQCGAKAANELYNFIARRPVDCLPDFGSMEAHRCDVFGRRDGSRGMASQKWIGA